MQIGSGYTITSWLQFMLKVSTSNLPCWTKFKLLALTVFFAFNVFAVKTYKLNTLSDSVATVTATSALPDRFYDDGGLSAKYSNSISNRSYTFNAVSGNYVRIRFYACDFKNGDYVTFYDGQQTTSRIIGESTYSGNGGFMIASTTGSLTVTFYSNFATNGNGWDADVWVTSNPGQTWLGGTSTNVNTTSNWEGNSLPTQWSSVLIPNGTTFSPDISNSRSLSCYDLSIRTGATLSYTGTSTATFRVYGNLMCDGRINHTGTLYVNLMGGLVSRFASLSGAGNLTNVSFAVGILGQAYYKLLSTLQINELVLSSTSGQSDFDMNSFDLKTYFIEIQPSVKFYQGSGALYIEESSAIIDDASFSEQSGTTYFSSGTLFTAQHQTLPAITYNHLTIQGGAIKSLAGNIDVNGNLQVVSGTLSPGSSTISLAGNFTNSSVFTAGTSTIKLDGSALQLMSTGGNTVYNLLVLNTGDGILLNDQLRLTNVCTFNDGIVSSSTSAPMVFASTATCTGQSDASHVNGPVKKESSSVLQFIFPIGNGLNYRPASVTPSSSIATTWQAIYYASGYANQLVKSSVQKVSSLEYWLIDRTGSTSAQVGLSYAVSSLTNLTTDVTKLVASHFDAVDAKWEAAGTTGGASNPLNGWVYTNTNWASFSPFTLGTVVSSNAALPVELVEFNLNCGLDNTLTWTTASEFESDYFSVEGSLDGVNWEILATLSAAQYSNEITTYAHKVDGKYQYTKLNLFDLNGLKRELGSLVVNCHKYVSFNTSPNPSEYGIHFYARINNASTETIVQLYSLTGDLLKEVKYHFNENIIEGIFDTHGLSSGFYLVKCIGNHVNEQIIHRIN